MKRILVLVVLAVVLTAVSAGPALAQRDPFGEDRGGSTEGSGNNDPAPQPAPEPPPPSVEQTEVLPITGPESQPWVAIAYLLLGIGGGSLALVRLYRTDVT